MRQDLQLRLTVLSLGGGGVRLQLPRGRAGSSDPNHPEVWRTDTGQPGDTFLRRHSKMGWPGSPAYHTGPVRWEKPACGPRDSLLGCQPPNPFLAARFTFPGLQS